VNQLTAFLTEIPPEHLALAAEILHRAEAELETRFAQGMVIPLADHISFAIKRVRQHIAVEYPLRSEVAHLYPKELRVARAAVTLVGERTGIALPPDEAVPIALHFVNALFATDDLSRTFRMTELFRQVFEILDSAYDRRFDTETINAARFITHLRYFFVRVDSGKQLVENPESFTTTIRTSFPQAFLCAERVKALLELRLEKPITTDEVVYLTLHVARLASE
jgi:beta-glucoside operon transcriptional antiterminator